MRANVGFWLGSITGRTIEQATPNLHLPLCWGVKMFFEKLQERLLLLLRGRVQAGEVTERSLAKLTEISQPHIHNVLKGTRKFSPEIADSILRKLGLTVLDLFDAGELVMHLSKNSRHEDQRYASVDMLDGDLGPGRPLPTLTRTAERFTVPQSQLKMVTDPVAARLAFDPQMRGTFHGGEVVLLDQSEMSRAFLEPQSLFVLLTDRGALVRKLRRRGDQLILLDGTGEDTGEKLDLGGRELHEVVVARVVWMNRRRRWTDELHKEEGAS